MMLSFCFAYDAFMCVKYVLPNQNHAYASKSKSCVFIHLFTHTIMSIHSFVYSHNHAYSFIVPFIHLYHCAIHSFVYSHNHAYSFICLFTQFEHDLRQTFRLFVTKNDWFSKRIPTRTTTTQIRMGHAIPWLMDSKNK